MNTNHISGSSAAEVAVPKPRSGRKKKITLVVLIILLAAVAASGFYVAQKKHLFNLKPANKQAIQPAGREVPASLTDAEKYGYADLHDKTVSYLKPESIPDIFPKDFPWEKNARILNNYMQPKDTAGQFTRAFVSQKTAEENFTLFQKYFKDNGWKVLNSYDQKDIKLLTVKKDQFTANVSINSGQTPGILSVVEASIIVPILPSNQKSNNFFKK